MVNIFLKVLELSLVGSYVIILVLAVRMLLNISKAPKWSSYLLWGIVFLRLILPVVPESDFSLVPAGMHLPQGVVEETEDGSAIQENVVLENKVQSNVAPEHVAAENMAENTVNDIGKAHKDDISSTTDGISSKTGGILSVMEISTDPTTSSVPSTETSKKVGRQEDRSIVLKVLAYVWLAGAALVGGYHFVAYHKFKRSLKDAVYVSPGVYEIHGRHISFVIGIWKPAIYLSDSLDEASREVVLCHEQVHLQRRDYLTKALALSIACVHWFNPLVWLSFYLMGKDCEMSCDEKVVSILGEESKKIYSYALLDEATGGGRGKVKHENMCAVLSFGEDSIKARIKHVLNFKKAPIWLVCGILALLIVLTAGLLSNRSNFKAEDFSASIAMGCSAKSYIQTEDGSFLTLTINDESDSEREVVVKLTEEKHQELLSQIELPDIVGVNMALNIPGSVLQERNLNRDSVDIWELLKDDYYDQYLTLFSISWIGEDDKGKGSKMEASLAQKTPEEALQSWMIAFTNRDADTLYALSHDKEAFQNWDMIVASGEGYAFVDSPAWPQRDDYTITYDKWDKEATIRYWMRNRPPEAYPAEETVKLMKDGDLYYVDHQTMSHFNSISTLEEFVKIYVPEKERGNATADRMSSIIDPWYGWIKYSGHDQYHMEWMTLAVLSGQDAEYYEAFKDPVTAAKIMLNLGEGTGEVTKYLYEPDDQNTLYDGTIVNVTYTFEEDYSMLQIPMILVDESAGVWTLFCNAKETADLTEEERDAYGAYVRNYLLEHPGQVIRVGNHYGEYTETIIDMDGDKKAEVVSYEKDKEAWANYDFDHFILKAGSYAERMYKDNFVNEIWAFSPDGVCIYLALYEMGPSGDPVTDFFYYEEGKLIHAGAIREDVEDLVIENGVVLAVEREPVIQTDSIQVQYGFDENGILKEVIQETYEFLGLNDITLLKEMTVYTEPGGTTTLIIKPQNVRFTKTDSTKKWIYMEAEDGTAGWFEPDAFSAGEKFERFEGLSMAG